MEKVKIISRPKLNGMGRHYGVMFSEEKCFDLQPFGVRQLSYKDFSAGYKVKVVQEVTCNGEVEKRLTLFASKKRKYCFVKFNCESFARYLVTGKAESKQIKYMAASSFAMGFAYYFFL